MFISSLFSAKYEAYSLSSILFFSTGVQYHLSPYKKEYSPEGHFLADVFLFLYHKTNRTIKYIGYPIMAIRIPMPPTAVIMFSNRLRLIWGRKPIRNDTNPKKIKQPKTSISRIIIFKSSSFSKRILLYSPSLLILLIFRQYFVRSVNIRSQIICVYFV